MSDLAQNPPQLEEVSEVAVETRQGISIVWLIPLIALLIGTWLAYKTISEKGPTVSITFQDGEGLEAGKTKIKYKSVEVGKVGRVDLSEDLTHVTVTAELPGFARPGSRIDVVVSAYDDAKNGHRK